MLRHEFIMLVGLPSSGKSTFANKLKDEGEYIIHSSDEIRKELFEDINNQSNNNIVFETLHKRVKADLLDGKGVIYDATNISYKRRMAFLKTIEKINCDKSCILMAVPYEECIKRNAEREKSVPEEVITRMYKNFYIPQYYEGWDNIYIHWDFDKNKFNSNKLFEELYKINQDNPHHSFTIGRHCEKCRENLIDILTSNGIKISTNDRLYLEYASFYHDIGKSKCKEYNEEKGHSTYYQHHLVGAYDAMFYTNVNGLGVAFSDNAILEVCNYIQWHMLPFQLRDAPQKTVENFIKLLGKEVFNYILLLHEADVKAK